MLIIACSLPVDGLFSVTSKLMHARDKEQSSFEFEQNYVKFCLAIS